MIWNRWMSEIACKKIDQTFEIYYFEWLSKNKRERENRFNDDCQE